MSAGRIIIVDDDPELCETLSGALGRRGFNAKAIGHADEALALLRDEDADAMVADVNLSSGESGLQLCQRVAESRPDLPVIIMTAQASFEVAVSALRAGAYDFVAKPVSADSLALALTRAVRHRQLTAEVRRLREAVATGRRGPGSSLQGESEAIRNVDALLDQLAESDASVLITGESGTGKELAARALHERGPRKGGPFVALNVAAMPATLLESELFGHVRGAFTDAKRAREGLFVQASGGTIFLDEIGDMPMEMQVKLLRVLQDRKVRPVGGDDELAWDARVVCATHRDVDAMVEEGTFRSDLYYRLNVVHVAIPPLRSRGGDVLILAQRFLERAARRSNKAVTTISEPAARKLLDYEWPGNVRELENSIERAVALTRMSEVGVDDLPERVRDHKSDRLVIDAADPEELVPLEEVERRYVRKVLSACQGNKTQAARVLGLDRRTLYRRLESLGLKED
jgi:two-component system response regulator HydG